MARTLHIQVDTPTGGNFLSTSRVFFARADEAVPRKPPSMGHLPRTGGPPSLMRRTRELRSSWEAVRQVPETGAWHSLYRSLIGSTSQAIGFVLP
jgi:hypothetical protein